MLKKIIALSDVFYKIAAGIEGVFESLDPEGNIISEDVKNFLRSTDPSKYRFYIPELRSNPNISLIELQEISTEIEEKEKVNPYLDKEIAWVGGIPEGMKKWALVQFRKIRKGLPYGKMDEKQENSYAHFKLKLIFGGKELVDWFENAEPNLSQYDWKSAIDASNDWHEAIAKGDAVKYKQGEESIVYNIKDPNYKGWTIRMVTSLNDLDFEGQLMDHCVGSYCESVERGKSFIYSLRDPSNNPHVTMETNSPDNFHFEQIMGKSNSDPKNEYKKLIGEWFKKLKNDGKAVKYHDVFDADLENQLEHVIYTDVRYDADLDTFERMYKDVIKSYTDNQKVDNYGLNKNTINDTTLAYHALATPLSRYKYNNKETSEQERQKISGLIDVFVDAFMKDQQKVMEATRDLEGGGDFSAKSYYLEDVIDKIQEDSYNNRQALESEWEKTFVADLIKKMKKIPEDKHEEFIEYHLRGDGKKAAKKKVHDELLKKEPFYYLNEEIEERIEKAIRDNVKYEPYMGGSYLENILN